MKVNYPVKTNFDLKVVKEALKPLGGRCAKIVDGKLEYHVFVNNKLSQGDHLKSEPFSNRLLP